MLDVLYNWLQNGCRSSSSSVVAVTLSSAMNWFSGSWLSRSRFVSLLSSLCGSTLRCSMWRHTPWRHRWWFWRSTCSFFCVRIACLSGISSTLSCSWLWRTCTPHTWDEVQVLLQYKAINDSRLPPVYEFSIATWWVSANNLPHRNTAVIEQASAVRQLVFLICPMH